MILTNNEREELKNILEGEISMYKLQMKSTNLIDDIEGEIAVLNNKLDEAYLSAEKEAKGLDVLEEILYKATTYGKQGQEEEDRELGQGV